MAGGLSTACFSQSPAEKSLYDKLAEIDVAAVETILKAPEKYTAVILYTGAGVALAKERLEDSGFLFYAAKLRSRFDRQCFPPKGTGADSPFLLFAALEEELGTVINPTLMAEPKTFSKVIERIKNWNPKAPQEYSPGYEFTDRLSEKDAEEAAKQYRTKYLSHMGDLSTLLNDAEYFAAFQVLQAYNFGPDDKRPTDLEREKAIGTMRRIQKDTGLSGFIGE
jgi:hypothetical protein